MPSALPIHLIQQFPTFWPTNPEANPSVEISIKNFATPIKQYLTPIEEYEQIYKEFHTQAIQEAIRTQPPNPIIQIQQPTADQVKKKLPKVHRTSLFAILTSCSTLTKQLV